MTRLIFDFWQAQELADQAADDAALQPAEHQLHEDPLLHVRADRRPDRPRARRCSCSAGEQGLNVDFVGGTAYSGRLVEPMDIGDPAQAGVARSGRRTGSRSSTRSRRRRPVREEPGTPTRSPTTTDQKTIVALANPPEGTTPRSAKTNVKDRASVIPDCSVEQIFSGRTTTATRARCSPSGRRRSERELVQAAIDRLFK